MSKEKQFGLQFKAGMPKEEIDVPLDFNEDCDDRLEVLRYKGEQQDKARREKRYFSAFKLIVGCLVFLGLIYAVEVISSAVLKRELSSITTEIVEIIKTLLFTLSGYLFARKENND